MKIITAAVVAAGLAMVGCASDTSQFKTSLDTWKARLDSDLPVGSSLEAVRAWGLTQSIPLHYDQRDRTFSGIAQRVKTPWPHFPCSEWLVLVGVQMSVEGKSTANEVKSAGVCL